MLMVVGQIAVYPGLLPVGSGMKMVMQLVRYLTNGSMTATTSKQLELKLLPHT